jgi:P-loop containing dynein motor region D4
MFPSLVNCCAIDWFMEWPDEALESVARRTLGTEAQSNQATLVAVALYTRCVFA